MKRRDRSDRSRRPVGAERKLNHWPLITVAITDDGQATVTTPAGEETVRETTLPATRDAVTQLVASYAREHLGRPVAVQITEPTGVFGLWVDVDATKSPRTSTDAAGRGGRHVARRPPPGSAGHIETDQGVAPTTAAAQSRAASPQPRAAAVPVRPRDRGRRGSLVAGAGVLALACVIAAVVMLITANHGAGRHVQASLMTVRRSGSTATVPAPKTGQMAADVHGKPRSKHHPRHQATPRPRAHLSHKPPARYPHARHQHPHHARPAATPGHSTNSTNRATTPTVKTAPVTPTPTATVTPTPTRAPAPIYTAPAPTPTPTVPTSSPPPEPAGGPSASAGPTGPGEQSGGCDPICK
jgi:hypothetical protein